MSDNYGVPTNGQLEKINILAKRTLSKDEVFSFHTKMIGDALLEDRLMQLSKPLLDVFKNDARTGIAFMLDHPWAGFMRPKPAYPYGRTYDATLKKSDGTLEGENWALFGDTYIVRGKEKDGVSTDGIIADIEDGTLFDVSIGFGFKNSTCSICGHEYYSGDCEHWRGQTYEGKLCFIIGKPPGWLGELSGVWDGAYPTAGVLSKDGSSEAQRPFVLLDDMPKEDLKKLPSDITTYGFYSATRGNAVTYFQKDDLAKGNVYKVPDLSNLKGGGKSVNEKTVKMLETFGVIFKEGETKIEDALCQLAEKWEIAEPAIKELRDNALELSLAKTAETGNAIGEALKTIETYMTQEQATTALGKELPADKVLSYAKDGEVYRTGLIDEALKMGVRAQGESFKQDTWAKNFELLSIQDIKDTMDTWQKQAKEEIPAGRQSQAGAGKGAGKQTIPDEFYKA